MPAAPETNVQSHMTNSTASIMPANVAPEDASLVAWSPLTMLGLMVVREVAKMVAVPVVPDADVPGVTGCALETGELLLVETGETTAGRGRIPHQFTHSDAGATTFYLPTLLVDELVDACHIQFAR